MIFFFLHRKFLLFYREQELFNHNEEYNVFFDHLVALVAESISQIPVSGKILDLVFFFAESYYFLFIVSQTKLLNLLEASNVIVRYIIKRFENASAPIILLKALKSLCEVEPSLENEAAYSSIKYMKYPDNSKSSNGSGSDKDSPKSEVKRSRSELSIVIMNQLMQPLTSGTVPLTNFSESQFDFTVSCFLIYLIN